MHFQFTLPVFSVKTPIIKDGLACSYCDQTVVALIHFWLHCETNPYVYLLISVLSICLSSCWLGVTRFMFKLVYRVADFKRLSRKVSLLYHKHETCYQ